VPKSKTKSADNKVTIKIKPSFKPEDKEDTLIREDKDSDYSSIISDLTQFQTQDFVGVRIAAFDNINTSNDNDTESTNEQFKSSNDNEKPLPNSPPQASLPTFSSTALLLTKQPHKPSAKQQSQNRYNNKKKKKEKEKKIKTNRTSIEEVRRQRY
jgi:hypothetical protein